MILQVEKSGVKPKEFLKPFHKEEHSFRTIFWIALE